jgi:hypothetical protein
MSTNRALARGRSCNTRNMSGEDDQEILRMVTLSLGMLKQDMSHARTSTMATDGLVPPTTASFRACSFATISSSRWMTQTSTCWCLDGSSSGWGVATVISSPPSVRSQTEGRTPIGVGGICPCIRRAGHVRRCGIIVSLAREVAEA